MYTKLSCFIGIFSNFAIHIFIIFLCIIFRIYYFLMLGFFSVAIILLLCVFVNILHVCLFFTNSNGYILSSGSVLFRVHTDIDKDGYFLQSNNNDSLNDLWLLFAALFLFLKVWLDNRSNIQLKLLHFNCFCAALFTQAYYNSRL